MGKRRDGRDRERKLFGTQNEWLKLDLLAAKESVKRAGESVGPSDMLWILVNERLEED